MHRALYTDRDHLSVIFDETFPTHLCHCRWTAIPATALIPSAVNLVSVSPRAAAVARSPYFPFHCQGTGSDRQVHNGYVNRCVLSPEPCVHVEFLVSGLVSPLRLA